MENIFATGRHAADSGNSYVPRPKTPCGIGIEPDVAFSPLSSTKPSTARALYRVN